jgi:hypothetical protein
MTETDPVILDHSTRVPGESPQVLDEPRGLVASSPTPLRPESGRLRSAAARAAIVAEADAAWAERDAAEEAIAGAATARDRSALLAGAAAYVIADAKSWAVTRSERAAEGKEFIDARWNVWIVTTPTTVGAIRLITLGADARLRWWLIRVAAP